jgi:hypothetical protein
MNRFVTGEDGTDVINVRKITVWIVVMPKIGNIEIQGKVGRKIMN